MIRLSFVINDTSLYRSRETTVNDLFSMLGFSHILQSPLRCFTVEHFAKFFKKYKTNRKSRLSYLVEGSFHFLDSYGK